MAKTSGSTRAKFSARDNKKLLNIGDIDEIFSKTDPLTAIQDDKLRGEVTQAISKFESRLGIGTQRIRIGKTGTAVGVHYTFDGRSYGIILNEKYFKNGTVESIRKDKKAAYDSGWLTRTNKSEQHTIIHELSHSVWNDKFTSLKVIKAKPEINKLWREFRKEKPKAYGTYSFSNKNEMVAEMLTKHVIGNDDKFSKKLVSILKSNKLIKTKRG